MTVWYFNINIKDIQKWLKLLHCILQKYHRFDDVTESHFRPFVSLITLNVLHPKWCKVSAFFDVLDWYFDYAHYIVLEKLCAFFKISNKNNRNVCLHKIVNLRDEGYPFSWIIVGY
jgi:hypothetical protein